MKQYENMKDSGVDWIGEIPGHWETAKLKFVADIKSGSTPKTKIKDYWGGEIDWFTPADLNANETVKELNQAERKISKLGLVESGCNLIPAGNIFVTNRAPIGGVAFVTTDFTTNQGCKAVIPKNRIKSKFLFYLLSSSKQELESLGNGATFKELSTQSLKSILIPYCDWNEQNQIVSFLDKKTANVDTLINKKQRKIELLKEKRKALINQAVTKGLNPDVPMKDSGVEWIGEIPEHWELIKLKYLAGINPSNHKDVSPDSRLVFLPMEKVGEEGNIDQSELKEYNQVNRGYTYFEKDDILLAKITPCFENGKSAYLNNLDTDIGFGSTEFHVVRPNHDICDEFLYYNLKRKGFKKVGETFMTGAAGQKRVSTDFLREWLIAVPRKEEQLKIVDFIKERMNEFNSTIKIETQKIELLKEYRQSLIAEVVTGKVDIGDEADAVLADGQQEVAV